MLYLLRSEVGLQILMFATAGNNYLMNKKNYYTYSFPDSKCLVVCGDIHGDFNLLVYKLCVQYQMKDTTCIVAGDCGFGFEKKEYYENIVKRNNKRMNEANNRIVFIRGNHDNPAYFDGQTFIHKRFLAIPDYSVVNVCNHAVLCVGGAISIDRKYRKYTWEQNIKKNDRFGHHVGTDILSPNYYWEDEAPIYDKNLLTQILSEYDIDAVITHTAPSFCELQDKANIDAWIKQDISLITDIHDERAAMDSIHDSLKEKYITIWCYGHFHQSWHAFIEGTLFKMLDIMELYEIR